jgi:hypothetical protein
MEIYCALCENYYLLPPATLYAKLTDKLNSDDPDVQKVENKRSNRSPWGNSTETNRSCLTATRSKPCRWHCVRRPSKVTDHKGVDESRPPSIFTWPNAGDIMDIVSGMDWVRDFRNKTVSWSHSTHWHIILTTSLWSSKFIQTITVLRVSADSN